MDRPAAGAEDEVTVRERADQPQSERTRRVLSTVHDMLKEILEEDGPERKVEGITAT